MTTLPLITFKADYAGRTFNEAKALAEEAFAGLDLFVSKSNISVRPCFIHKETGEALADVFGDERDNYEPGFNARLYVEGE